MQIIEWWSQNSKKPFGIIGIDDKGKLFVKGLDGEEYLYDLESNIFDENDDQLTAKDGTKFLEAVMDRYMRNVGLYQGKLNIKGPFEVRALPELEV